MMFRCLVCPENCECDQHDDGLSILSGVDAPPVKLPYVLPIDVVALRISGSNISMITTDFLSNCVNLAYLDMSYNEINMIEAYAFEGLVSLLTIKLTHTALYYNMMSFPSNLFIRLPHLEVLELQGQANPIESTWNEFRSFVKILPTNLKALHIDVQAVPCENFSGLAFARFTDLQELGLYNREDCFMEFRNNTFEAMKNVPISDLKIKIHDLRKVEPLAFHWFPNLTHLDMSFTYGMSIADFYPAWFGLRFTQLTHLDFTYFKRHIIGNISPTAIRRNHTFFEKMQLPHLSLDLSNTQIHSADEWKFHLKTLNLTHLSVSNNSLDVSELEYLTKDTQHLKHLSFLDVSFQLEEFLDWKKFVINLSPEVEELRK